MTLFDDPDPGPTTRDPSLVRVRMVVAYDGSAFHGFAANRDVATVAGTLQQAIELVVRAPVVLTAAGRTDKGVHAWGQVVSCDLPVELDALEDLRRSLNRICGDAIVVREIATAPADFDARHSATSRVYRYTVLNQWGPDPFAARTAWHVEPPLDLRAMQLACDPLIGEHDFSSFCRRPPTKRGSTVEHDVVEASLVRRVIDARWSAVDFERGSLLRFEIEARAFCHQMVRSIVGTMVAVGTGRKRAGDVAFILRSRDRAHAGQLAPPHGLCLWQVRY